MDITPRRIWLLALAFLLACCISSALCPPDALAVDKAANLKRLEELKQKRLALEKDLKAELQRLHKYLSLYDQVQRMAVAMGRQSLDQADEKLRQTAQDIFKDSYQEAQLRNLRGQHQKAANEFFQYMQAKAAASRTWPKGKPAAQYRSLAQNTLQRLSGQYQAAIGAGQDPADILSEANQVLGWSRGQRDLPAGRRYFAEQSSRLVRLLAETKIALTSKVKSQPGQDGGAGPGHGGGGQAADGSQPSDSAGHSARPAPGIPLLVYASDKKRGLWVMQPDGKGRRVVSKSEIDYPIWNPTGSNIFGVKRTYRGSYLKNISVLVDAQGKELITKLGFLHKAAWSPNGQYLIYESGSAMGGTLNLWLADPHKSLVRKITNNGKSRDAAWSPDGKTIAFAVGWNQEGKIFLIDADGSNQRELAQGSAPAWSHDGGKLIYLNSSKEHSWLHEIKPDGSGARKLCRLPVSQRVALSPDGKHVLFVYVAKQGDKSWVDFGVCQADGKNQVLHSQGAYGTKYHQWSPDGSRVFYTRVAGKKGRGSELWSMDVSGQDQLQLTKHQVDGKIDGFSFSPRLDHTLAKVWLPSVEVAQNQGSGGLGMPSGGGPKGSSQSNNDGEAGVSGDKKAPTPGDRPKGVGQLPDLDDILTELASRDGSPEQQPDAAKPIGKPDAKPEIAVVVRKDGTTETKVTLPAESKAPTGELFLEAEKLSQLAEALYRQRKYQQAMDAFNQALELRQDHARSWYFKGTVARELKDYQLSEQCIARALQLEPNNARYLNGMGITFSRQKKLDEAVAAFRMVLQIRPDYATARANLAGALYRQAVHEAKIARKQGKKRHWVFDKLNIK